MFLIEREFHTQGETKSHLGGKILITTMQKTKTPIVSRGKQAEATQIFFHLSNVGYNKFFFSNKH